MNARPDTNDTVRLLGSPQLWKVITTINGSKVDIQRLNDYNLQILTVTLDAIQVVRAFGSPDSFSPPLSPSAAQRALLSAG